MFIYVLLNSIIATKKMQTRGEELFQPVVKMSVPDLHIGHVMDTLLVQYSLMYLTVRTFSVSKLCLCKTITRTYQFNQSLLNKTQIESLFLIIDQKAHHLLPLLALLQWTC